MASDNEEGEVDDIQFEEVDLDEEASEKWKSAVMFLLKKYKTVQVKKRKYKTVRYFLCTEHIDCKVKVKVETNTHSPIVHAFMTNNTHAQEIRQRSILP